MTNKARNIPFSLEYFRKRGLLYLLAYETGVHLGDGGMEEKYYLSQKSVKRQLQYTGDLVNELTYYENVLRPIIVKLYGLWRPIYKKDRDHSCVIYTRKKDIIDFKKKIGIPLGKKINLQVPLFIRGSLISNFLRGFADTDFCLTFRNRKKTGRSYPVISFKTSDKLLIVQLSKMLERLEFKPVIIFNMRNKHKKSPRGYYDSNSLELNGKENLKKWMNLIGFWSPKHLSKYLLWKATGSCPIRTTTEQRCKVLKDLGIEINEYLPP